MPEGFWMAGEWESSAPVFEGAAVVTWRARALYLPACR